MNQERVIEKVCVWSFHPLAASNLRLTLDRNEAHVWCASLDVEASYIQDLRHILTLDEIERAERFYFQRDRNYFIVARGLLRTILGCYLNLEPSQLRFCYSSKGKPALEPTQGRIFFNLSHSHGLALYAITCEQNIGVDIEWINPDVEVLEIAKRCFSANEYASLLDLPSLMRTKAFFTYWTLKEAYIKARGEGLSIGLNQFDVSLLSGTTAPLKTAWDAKEGQYWSLQIAPATGYAAALVVKGDYPQLSCWQWL